MQKLVLTMQTASGSSPNTLSFSLNDTNEKRLDEAVTQLNAELTNIDAVTEVTNSLDDTVEEIQITVDREKASDNGLVPYQLAQSVNNITRGAFATQIISEENEVFGVLVQYDEKYRDSIDKLRKLKIRNQMGEFVQLGDVATVEIAEGPVAIRRVDQAHSVTFNVKYKSTETLGQMTKKVNDTLDKIDLPKEIDVTY